MIFNSKDEADRYMQGFRDNGVDPEFSKQSNQTPEQIDREGKLAKRREQIEAYKKGLDARLREEDRFGRRMAQQALDRKRNGQKND